MKATSYILDRKLIGNAAGRPDWYNAGSTHPQKQIIPPSSKAASDTVKATLNKTVPSPKKLTQGLGQSYGISAQKP